MVSIQAFGSRRDYLRHRRLWCTANPRDVHLRFEGVFQGILGIFAAWVLGDRGYRNPASDLRVPCFLASVEFLCRFRGDPDCAICGGVGEGSDDLPTDDSARRSCRSRRDCLIVGLASRFLLASTSPAKYSLPYLCLHSKVSAVRYRGTFHYECDRGMAHRLAGTPSDKFAESLRLAGV